MCRNIVNRGEVIAAAANGAGGAQAGIVACGIGEGGRSGFAEQFLENALEETRAFGAALRSGNT